MKGAGREKSPGVGGVTTMAAACGAWACHAVRSDIPSPYLSRAGSRAQAVAGPGRWRISPPPGSA